MVSGTAHEDWIGTHCYDCGVPLSQPHASACDLDPYREGSSAWAHRMAVQQREQQREQQGR